MLVGLSFKVFDFFYERGRIQLNSGHMKIDNLLVIDKVVVIVLYYFRRYIALLWCFLDICF